jgi:hypothetical protein
LIIGLVRQRDRGGLVKARRAGQEFVTGHSRGQRSLTNKSPSRFAERSTNRSSASLAAPRSR